MAGFHQSLEAPPPPKSPPPNPPKLSPESGPSNPPLPRLPQVERPIKLPSNRAGSSPPLDHPPYPRVPPNRRNEKSSAAPPSTMGQGIEAKSDGRTRRGMGVSSDTCCALAIVFPRVSAAAMSASP